MNILLINHYAGSSDMGMEFRPYYFSREWIKAGHNVHIIAGDYSHLRRKNPDVERNWKIEKIDDIYYHWVKTGEYKGNGVARAITMERFVRKIILNANEIINIVDPDVIICSSTYPLDTYAGQRLRKIANSRRLNDNPVKLIHEIHDMWPATLIELGGMKKSNPFVVAMQIAEESAYKNSDIIISIPKYTRGYMMEHGMEESKWYHVPNGIYVAEWENPRDLTALHKEILDSIKGKGEFIVGYFGGHAMSNALDILIDVAKVTQRRNPNIHFVLVGNGVEKPNLIQRTEDEKIENVTFLSSIDKREIPNLCDMFDCIYMGTSKSSLYRFGLSLNKMVDAMMSGKPVVCSITSPPTWVEEAESGIVVESGDVSGVYNAIEIIYNMSEKERIMMGTRGRDYVEKHLSVEENARQMLDIIN